MPSQITGAAREGRAVAVPTIRSLPRLRTAIFVAPLAVALTGPDGRAAADGATPAVIPPPSAARSTSAQSGDKTDTESVVSAKRMPASASQADLAAASSVIVPADSPRARDDLGTLLLEVPGATVTRRGGFGSFATLSLRGANPDEVRIYVDGIPLNQSVGGAVDLSTLPLGDVERVEVYRGSSPMELGESALGGAVSILTRTPGTAEATARVGVGSFRTTFADGTAGGRLGRLKWYAGVHTLRAIGDFPFAASGVAGAYQVSARENNDLAQMDGVMRVALPLPGRRDLRAGVIGVWHDQGLAAQEIYRAVAARATTARWLGHLDYESRDDLGPSSRLRAALYGSVLRDAFSDPLHEIAGVPTATHDVTWTIGTTANAEKAFGDWARVTALVEARHERYFPHNDADPTMTAGYPAQRQTGTAGTELDARISPLKLHLLPSARLQVSRDVRTGRDLLFGTHLGPSPPLDRVLPVLRLGLLRPFSKGASLRANIGRYARIPTFIELYGYNRGIIGNPGLGPERGVNADVGVAVNRAGPVGDLVASATLFGATVDDLIAWETHAYQTRAENVSRARVLGVETELRVRHRRLSVIAQVTLTDARDRGQIATSAGRQLAHHPRDLGYGRVEWTQSIARSNLSTTAYADVEGSSGNYWTTGVYGALPARLLFGAGLSLLLRQAGLKVSLSGFNLGDSRVYDFPGYPQPGRSVFVALGWSSVTSPAPPD